MTPTSLGALIIRFMALGLLVYGVILLIRGLIAQSEINQMQNSFQALIQSEGEDQSGGFSINFFDGKMVRIQFLASGITLLVSVLLYWWSRQLGALIARGVQ